MTNLYRAPSIYVSYQVSVSEKRIFRNRPIRNKHRLWWPCLSMDQNEMSTPHRRFLPSFGSFGKAVSEEKIFRNRPIKNKNCLWQPCLLTDREEMNTLYRGHSIYDTYQVSVHLAKQFQRRRFLEIDQSETSIAYGGHVCLQIKMK